MWQDLLALLIVALATLALLRRWLPNRVCGGLRGTDGASPSAAASPATGCSDCALGLTCSQFEPNQSARQPSQWPKIRTHEEEVGSTSSARQPQA